MNHVGWKKLNALSCKLSTAKLIRCCAQTTTTVHILLKKKARKYTIFIPLARKGYCVSMPINVSTYPKLLKENEPARFLHNKLRKGSNDNGNSGDKTTVMYLNLTDVSKELSPKQSRSKVGKTKEQSTKKKKKQYMLSKQ